MNRGRHLCSAGRPSRWALAHILVVFNSYNTDTLVWCSFRDIPSGSPAARLKRLYSVPVVNTHSMLLFVGVGLLTLSYRQCETNSTRHRASTSTYSLTFYVRFLLPERHQRKHAVQAAAVMLRTPPSTANHRRASHAHSARFSGHGGHTLSWRSHGHSLAA